MTILCKQWNNTPKGYHCCWQKWQFLFAKLC